ncbi:MAG TPA: phosphorylase [Trichocoleus sp.]
MQRSPVPLFQPGTLLASVQERTAHALACGALQPIETNFTFLEQGNMRFLVRQLASLARKERARAAQTAVSQAIGKEINPFLPYEEDLFVTHISDTHLCLLNKYNVVNDHILIVTRAFEEQDSWLTAADFEALWACMAEIDGLAFYNGGRLAGASQRHKHLQLVPLPLAPDGSALSLDSLLQTAALEPTGSRLPVLPFEHVAIPLAEGWPECQVPGEYLLDCYRQAMAAIGLDLQALLPNRAYNLLLTRSWMLAVPRAQESHHAIPVNALGFAGSLLVKNAEQMALLEELGPMTLLQSVAYPRAE